MNTDRLESLAEELRTQFGQAIVHRTERGSYVTIPKGAFELARKRGYAVTIRHDQARVELSMPEDLL